MKKILKENPFSNCPNFRHFEECKSDGCPCPCHLPENAGNEKEIPLSREEQIKKVEQGTDRAIEEYGEVFERLGKEIPKEDTLKIGKDYLDGVKYDIKVDISALAEKEEPPKEWECISERVDIIFSGQWFMAIRGINDIGRERIKGFIQALLKEKDEEFVKEMEEYLVGRFSCRQDYSKLEPHNCDDDECGVAWTIAKHLREKYSPEGREE